MKPFIYFLMLVTFLAGCNTYSVVSTNPVEPLERLPPKSRIPTRPYQGNGLPSNPDPNKCYVRTLTMNEYDIEYNDFLTYTEEEAAIYPHDEIEVISESAYSAWENVYKEGCTSTNPKNCYVLCHKKYPAVTTTIYKPIDQEEGSPYLKTIGKKTLVSKGGLTVWVEIDCELTTFSVLPIYFAPKTTRLLTTDLSVINSELITLLEEQPAIRFEINVHTDSRGIDEANLQLSQGRAMAIIDYIATQGINPDRLIARGLGETRLKNRCSNNVVCSSLEHAVNERVEFRAVNESF